MHTCLKKFLWINGKNFALLLPKISEVFEDVAERIQSKEFVVAIKERAKKVVNDEERRSVYVDISFAEEKIILWHTKKV